MAGLLPRAALNKLKTVISVVICNKQQRHTAIQIQIFYVFYELINWF